MDTAWAPASEIAAAVADVRTSASAVVRAALARIVADDPVLNAFTAVLEDRALAKARAIDAARLAGHPLGALAGVPFAVKNLFDVAGLPTLAGSQIHRERGPAPRDATLLAPRRSDGGAGLRGALGRAGRARDCARQRGPAHRDRRRLFPRRRLSRGAKRARPRCRRARRGHGDRASASQTRTRRGLCHHRSRGGRASPRAT